jgi:2-polyprenyl-3-methyl-5-hydroxy-6-metoxy-1,4-benzoquinol methylase
MPLNNIIIMENSLNRLTSKDYWNETWSGVKLPAIVERDESNAVIGDGIDAAVIDIFDRFFPRDSKVTVLELGGAPGRFLAYCACRYGCSVHSLDYSDIGCKVTIENFRQLNLPVTVYQQDIFDTSKPIGQFDVVFSLGLIEHFEDTKQIIERHWQMVKPGGLLILGVPHFVHVFWPVLEIVAPNVTRGHNRDALVLEKWSTWETSLQMKAVYKAYLGGFDPMFIRSMIKEERSCYKASRPILSNSLEFGLRCLGAVRRRARQVFPRLDFLDRINGSWASSYAIGVYQRMTR